jgi:lipid A disaccharide synthetase
MPEILQRRATPENLATALVSIVEPSAQRQRQLAAFAKFDTVMGIGRDAPATLAAEIVLQLLNRPVSL